MPAKDSTVTGFITAVDRVGTSTNGNPTYDITLADGDGMAQIYRTQTDAACGYSAANYRPRWNDDYKPVPAVLTLTPAGRVRYLTRPDGTDA